MIIDDTLLREEYLPDSMRVGNFGKVKSYQCIITKAEFLECYNAWVDPAEHLGNVEDDEVLPELPQYHFDRDAFVSTFEQVFTDSEIVNIEDLCQHHKQIGNFLLFYSSEEEFYIIHLPSGTIINWYKHLGRTNTCNKENFTITGLKNFLERLKVDINEHAAS